MKLFCRLSTLLMVALSVALIGCEVKKGNTASFDSSFGLLLPGTPVVGSVTPPQGPDSGGITVTINGSGFRNDATVLFGNVPATNIVVLGFDKIQCTLPPGRVGKVDVSVANVDGNFFILRNGFEYVHFEVDPNHGPPIGLNQVFVRGSGFLPGMKVYFGAGNQVNPSNLQVIGPNTLEITQAPASPGGVEQVVDVILVYPNGNTTTLARAYSYTGWVFETPDNAATDIRAMASILDANDQTVSIAVGYRGLVNIKIGNNDWKYTDLKRSGFGDSVLDNIAKDSYGTLPDFLGVWIGDNGDDMLVVIVGEQEIMLKNQQPKANMDWGTGWIIVQNTQNTTIEYNDVHGVVDASQNFHVYVAGDQGYIIESSDGLSSHSKLSSGVTNNLFGVYAIGPTEILFCGSSGTVVYFNGITASTIDVSSTYDPYYKPTFYDIAKVENKSGGGTNKVYIVGSPSYPSVTSYSYISTVIQGVGGSGVYTWSRMESGTISSSSSTLYGVYAANDKDAYASGRSAMILQLDSTDQWNIMPYGSKYQHSSVATTWTYYGITGYADTGGVVQQVWVGGSRGRIMHHSPPANLVGLSPLNKPHMWFQESLGSITPNTINDIHANAWNNVWAVGTGGTVFQGESTSGSNIITWKPRTNLMPAASKLYGVWTAGPGTTWACGENAAGDGVIYFWDGGKWHDPAATVPSRFCKTVPGTKFRDIYGYGPQAVWAVGDGGFIYKWDGNSWLQDGMTTANPPAPVTTENLKGVFASQSSSGFTKIVVAVGDKGTGVVLSGGIWTAATTGTTEGLYGIHGATPYSMYAVGDNGTVLAFSSYGNWTQAPLPSGTTTTNYRSVHYSDVDDIIACGDNGTMVAYRGTPVSAWITLRSPTTSTINSIFSVDTNETFLCDGSGTLYRGHSHWVVQVVRTLTIRNYNFALFVPYANNPDDIWVIASDGSSARKREGKWSRIDTPVGSSLYCMYAFNDADIYAVGSRGKILHYDGTWSEQTSNITSTLYWIWGTTDPAKTLFTVGTSQQILKGDGTTGGWSNPSHTVNGVTGYDWITWVGGEKGNDVWATGDYTLAHYNGNGTDWTGSTPVNGTVSSWLVQNWRNPANGNIYAVGYSGQIAIYNKGIDQWTVYKGTGVGGSGTTNALWFVWGIDDNNVWAVGNSGTIVKWNGATWTAMTTPTTNTLYGISGDTTTNSVYACGRDGTLLKYDTTNPTAGWIQENFATDQDFFYVTCKNGRVIITSEFGTVLVR